MSAEAGTVVHTAGAEAAAGRRTVPKVLLFANTDWYLWNFRLPLARAIRARGAEVVFVSPPGPYAGRLVAAGFRWLGVSMSRRGMKPWQEAATLMHLVHIYRRERPDVVHHFTLKCILYGGLAARAAGVRRIVSAVTGMGYVFASDDLAARAARPLVRRLLRAGTGGRHARLVVQNPDDREAVVASGMIGRAQVRLIPGSGVDTRRFRPHARREDEAGGPFRFLFAARLLRDKGLADYVAAAQALRASGVAAEFLVAGETDPGNPASFDDADIAAWRAQGAVRFLGQVEDMPALMATVDAMVLPTTYREGVPRSLIEAAAAGLPVVTTDSPGCRDIVADGHNGFLVPKRDACALADALRRLATDRVAASRMGRAGRAKVLSEFDERIVLARTLAVYGELLPAWRWDADDAQACGALPAYHAA